ncbi:hypothetical protein ACA910_006640 [Epithemia clementina (nom. ined.)]
MKSIRNIATAVRKQFFRRSVEQQTRTLDPAVRSALAQDIAEDENDLATELQQIENDLEQAKEALAKAEERETFLGQRSRQYRVALDERARTLRQEQKALEQERQQRLVDNQEDQDEEGGGDQDNDNDKNNNNDNNDDDEEKAAWRERWIDLEQRTAHWERDEDALTSVIQTHKTILAECERMRRKIKELESKREHCRSMATDVGDFLTAAAGNHDDNHDRDDENENNDDGNGNAPSRTRRNQAGGPTETELCTLVPSTHSSTGAGTSGMPREDVNGEEQDNDDGEDDQRESTQHYPTTSTSTIDASTTVEEERQAMVHSVA